MALLSDGSPDVFLTPRAPFCLKAEFAAPPGARHCQATASARNGPVPRELMR